LPRKRIIAAHTYSWQYPIIQKIVAENISQAMSISNEAKFASARRIQFAFTDEQEQFRAAIRRFLQEKSSPADVRRLMDTAEGYDPEIWRQLSEQLALPGIHICCRRFPSRWNKKLRRGWACG